MRNLGLGLMLATMAMGCKGPGSWEGIWMVQVPFAEQDECEPTVNENYKDASVPEDEEEEEGDFTEDTKTKVSDAIYFVQVLEQGGEVFVFVDDTPYYGTAEGKTLTASWTDSSDSDYVGEHVEGYRYEYEQKSEVTTTYTFTRGEKGVVTGTLETVDKSERTWTESDDWDRQDVGFQDGQMNATVNSWLEADEPGGTQNTAQEDECDGDECELVVKTNCKDSVDVQVFYAGDHDEGMYNSLEDAERGFGGS